MEFQGGEPTLVPHLIRRAIEYAEEKNRTENREITYVVCTNSVNLTDELLDLCKRSGAVISTSLDGPQFLHDHNRGKRTAISALSPELRRLAKNWAKAGFPH